MGPLPHKTDMMFVLRWSGPKSLYEPLPQKFDASKHEKRHSHSNIGGYALLFIKFFGDSQEPFF
jgi:hypothetical protein